MDLWNAAWRACALVVVSFFSGCGGCGTTNTGTETECAVAGDCAAGKTCNEGACVAVTACVADVDCNGHYCVGGVCQSSPNETVDAGRRDAGGSSSGGDAGNGDAATGPVKRLAFDPDETVEFGASRLGISVSRTVSLVNTGEAAVTVFSMTLSAGASSEFTFQPTFLAAPLGVGESVTITITHLPTDGAPDSARLQVFSDARNNPVELQLEAAFKNDPELEHVALPGRTAPDGGANPEINSVDFGEVGVGFLSQKRVFLRNLSVDSALEIQPLQLTTDAPAGTFAILTDRNLPTFISTWEASCALDADCGNINGATCVEGACRTATGYVDQLTVTIQFTPPAEGNYTAVITVPTNDEGGGGGNPEAPLILSVVGEGKSNCPARFGANGTYDPGTQTCSYACQAGFHDLDGDRNNFPISNGCEYECTPDVNVLIDTPDLNGVDADCDGLDGEAEPGAAVFVWSGANPVGADGSKEHPYVSLQDGINAAMGDGGANPAKPVYLADGSYGGNNGITLANGVSIYGGYAAGQGWRVRGGTSFISGSNEPVVGTGISLTTTLQKLTIQALPGTTQDPISVGLRLVDSPGVILEACTITAGNGADGVDGTPGSPGVGGAALNGANGENGCDVDNSQQGFGVCSAFGDDKRGGWGGAGGVNSACNANAGGAGGMGGFSHPDDWFFGGVSAEPGVDGAGAQAGYAAGGDAGGRAATCPDAEMSCPSPVDCWGGVGVEGGNGRGGDPGLGGVAAQSLMIDAATGALAVGVGGSGQDGVPNAEGGGGGGGGGGGSCSAVVGCYDDDDSCASDGAPGGGGGGAAGCVGTGGVGGRSGGSSIGLLLVRSAIQVVGGGIVAGTAGNGGSGADGGEGGEGGAGGEPGLVIPERQRAGYAGRGGRGGKGGHGGGGAGGAGGHSYAVYAVEGIPNLAVPGRPVPALTAGVAGSGGAGGSGAVLANGDSCRRSNPSECGNGQSGPNGTSATTNF
ncbi:MAG: choice-of-anchor D domain-containing protein [Myxococcota bacterium]